MNMEISVTVVTQRDKVFLCICTELSAELNMVNMKVLLPHRTGNASRPVLRRADVAPGIQGD